MHDNRQKTRDFAGSIDDFVRATKLLRRYEIVWQLRFRTFGRQQACQCRLWSKIEEEIKEEPAKRFN